MIIEKYGTLSRGPLAHRSDDLGAGAGALDVHRVGPAGPPPFQGCPTTRVVRPSFMIATASVSPAADQEFLLRQGSRQDNETSSCRTSGRPPAADAAAVTRSRRARARLGYRRRQPIMEIHVRAVEQRVALGQHDDVTAGVEVTGQPFGRVVENAATAP